MTIKIVIESDIIRSYRRLAYTPWHALAEFVDNSTQSYFNNEAALKPVLEAEKETLEVRIVYDRNGGFLRVSDNAMGMSYDELARALQIGKPPSNTSGRSEYGLGMKTAACWLGNVWEVKTKKLGETTEYAVTINVEKIASGDLDLEPVRTEKPAHFHYTIIEIRDLNMKIQGRRLNKIKDFLPSMYRSDIRNGVLQLFWGNGDTPLPWQDEGIFHAAHDGTPYKKDFDFEVDGKRVWGWLGILGEGSASRGNAGFSMLRRGRVLRGHPKPWRPETIFGWEGRNDLINQRLTGEVNLDEFEVSHTKDDILWEGKQEDDVEEKLKEAAGDYIRIANTPRKRGPQNKRGPSQVEIDAGVDQLKTEIGSSEFVDAIDLDDVPPPHVVDEANRPIVEAALREEPAFTATVGSTPCKLYLSSEESPNDPYFVTDITPTHILVIINTQHPHWNELDGATGVLNYLRHCVYDAIAEWRASRQKKPLHSGTIKLLKDRLLRLPAEIEQAGGSGEASADASGGDGT